jgi:hypothetical protein
MNNVHSRVSNVRNDEEGLVVCDDAPIGYWHTTPDRNDEGFRVRRSKMAAFISCVSANGRLQ